MKQVQYLIPAALIFDGQGRILLVQKSRARTPLCINRWEIPGGTTKFGESFEKALKRKIKEYLGVEIAVKRIIPYVHSNVALGRIGKENVKMQFYVVGAICKLIGSREEIKPKKGKIAKICWFDFKEIAKMKKEQIVPGDKEMIKTSGIY